MDSLVQHNTVQSSLEKNRPQDVVGILTGVVHILDHLNKEVRECKAKQEVFKNLLHDSERCEQLQETTDVLTDELLKTKENVRNMPISDAKITHFISEKSNSSLTHFTSAKNNERLTLVTSEKSVKVLSQSNSQEHTCEFNSPEEERDKMEKLKNNIVVEGDEVMNIKCMEDLKNWCKENLEIEATFKRMCLKGEVKLVAECESYELKERIMRKGKQVSGINITNDPSWKEYYYGKGNAENYSTAIGSRHGEANGGKPIKVMLLGLEKVGKTALIYQFLYQTIPDKYKATVDDTHYATFNASKERKIVFEILDTSGALEFPAMLDLSIKQYDVFVLVYDASNPSTFKKVTELREQIMRTKNKPPIVIVANKIDLCTEENNEEMEKRRHIVVNEWCHAFVDASAKENRNTWNVFQELLKQANIEYDLRPAMNKRRQSLPPPQHNSRASLAHVSLSPAQLQHLEQIRENSDRSSDKGRNSCSVS